MSSHEQNEISVLIETADDLTLSQQRRVEKRCIPILNGCSAHFTYRVRPDLLGGLVIHFDTFFIDDSVAGKLRRFQSKMRASLPALESPETLLNMFIQKMSDLDDRPIVVEVGRVQSISDGIARVSDLPSLAAGDCVEFEGGARGLALNLDKTGVDVAVFNNITDIREGTRVFRSVQGNTVPVGFKLLGRVINPLGDAVDGKGSVDYLEKRPVHTPAPSIIARASVHTPLATGVLGIDALVPIGRGQRELIIGDRQTGKTSLITDIILNQQRLNDLTPRITDKVFCVYVAIGQKQSAVYELMRTLESSGAMKYTVIVAATASDGMAMQYLAPYAGCAIAEYFRDKGMHAVVFYDDLSKHAVAYREMSLLLKRPAGREAYPGDVFYLHSRLLERAAQLDDAHGGGSLTAIPVVETLEGDVSAYIPTNVISITDGQIFLDNTLFNQGIRPAINVGLSVSRVGAHAQTAAMREASARLKADLAQYREMLSFSQLSTDLDASTQSLLKRGARMTEALKQPVAHPKALAQEVVILFAGMNGYLDKVQTKKVGGYLNELYVQIVRYEPELMEQISYGGVLTDEIKASLHTFLTAFTDRFVKNEDVL